jgi:TRAP-type mannitol/chloroaromatic compound transport system substrate-binding protein
LVGKSLKRQHQFTPSGRIVVMKRRNFIQAAGAGLAATAIAKPAIAQSYPEVKWRLTSSFPKSLDTIYGAAETFWPRTVAESDRRQVPGTGLRRPAKSCRRLAGRRRRLKTARSRCATPPSYYYVGKDPTFAIATAVPFGLNARQQNGLDVLGRRPWSS